MTKNFDHLFDVPSLPLSIILEKMECRPGMLSGKVALVTGGARGMGEQIARGLAHLGAKLIIVDCRTEGNEIARSIQTDGGEAYFFQKDISFENNLTWVLEQIGSVDILVNNAVHFPMKPFVEMPIGEWDLTMGTNVRAMVLACQQVLPGMLAKKQGVIMNMIALEGMAYASAMSSSKMAIRSLMFSLAAEIKPEEGVHIFGFAPGLVATPLIKEVFIPYCEYIGVSFEDYVQNISENPGYPGMMPAIHCGAAVVHAIVHAEEHHGLVTGPFTVLDKYGVISINNNELIKEKQANIQTNVASDNANRLNRYIEEVSDLNARIEHKIGVRTKELEKEKRVTDLLLDQLSEKSIALETINQQLDSFVYRVSHDLKSPIVTMLGMVNVLKGRVDLSDNINANLIENIEKLGVKFNTTVMDMMELSRVEKGIASGAEHIYLEELTNEIKVENQLNIKKGGIEFQVDFSGCREVYFSKIDLKSILQNLLTNAIKYSDPHKASTIKIQSLKKDDHISIEVIDNGIGIDMDKHKDKLFNMFQRFHNHVEGTGVGLYIIKRILENAGGSIKLASKLNEGTEVCVNIPVFQEREKAI